MLVQPSRAATVCEVDRARERAASCNRVQNLGYRTNKYWRICHCRSETILLTPIASCEACSGFTHVTARQIAQPPKAAFVTRLQPFRLPGRAARQLPDQSTTLWVESSSTDDSRLRGALPLRDMVTWWFAEPNARHTRDRRSSGTGSTPCINAILYGSLTQLTNSMKQIVS